jgi:preprotein translocase subunit YajC
MLHPIHSLVTFQDGTPTPIPSTTTAVPANGQPGATGTAETAPAQEPPGIFSWLPMIGIFAVVWFLMIAPERKNRKKREAMLSELGKGDRVLTSSGIYGTIVQMQDQVVTVQIADGVRVRMNMSAIQQLEKETSDSAEKAKA